MALAISIYKAAGQLPDMFLTLNIYFYIFPYYEISQSPFNKKTAA